MLRNRLARWVGGALAGLHLGDDLSALQAGKAWPPVKVPAGLARIRQAVHGPLADHCALKLRERAKGLGHQPACGGRGVHRLGQSVSRTRADCGNRFQREQQIISERDSRSSFYITSTALGPVQPPPVEHYLILSSHKAAAYNRLPVRPDLRCSLDLAQLVQKAGQHMLKVGEYRVLHEVPAKLHFDNRRRLRIFLGFLRPCSARM